MKKVLGLLLLASVLMAGCAGVDAGPSIVVQGGYVGSITFNPPNTASPITLIFSKTVISGSYSDSGYVRALTGTGVGTGVSLEFTRGGVHTSDPMEGNVTFASGGHVLGTLTGKDGSTATFYLTRIP